MASKEATDTKEVNRTEHVPRAKSDYALRAMTKATHRSFQKSMNATMVDYEATEATEARERILN
jgi:hypothetical protein